MITRWYGLRKDADEGERIPFGYGGAWLLMDQRRVVNIIIPFNVLFSLLRRLYILLVRRFVYVDPIEKAIENRARAMFYEWRDRELKLYDQYLWDKVHQQIQKEKQDNEG